MARAESRLDAGDDRLLSLPLACADAASGRRLPSLAVTLAYVSGCDGDGQEFVAAVLELVDGRRMVVVAGPSGSGKSSHRCRRPQAGRRGRRRRRRHDRQDRLAC